MAMSLGSLPHSWPNRSLETAAATIKTVDRLADDQKIGESDM